MRVTEKLGFKYLLDHITTTRYETEEDAILTVLYRSEWENEKNVQFNFR